MPHTGTEHRKLAAIMFTDMVGYSALAQQNEALALELIEMQQQLLRPLLPRFQGREIKPTGDGFLIEFDSALAATQCAIEIQKTLAAHNATVSFAHQIRIRIGVHLGDVVHREADMYGDGVNIAARIEPLADAGGICLSRSVVDQIQNKIETPLVKLGTPDLKNIEIPLEVYKVVLPWEGSPGPRRSAKITSPKSRKGKPSPALLVLGVLLLTAAITSIIVFAANRRKPSTGPAGALGPAGKTQSQEQASSPSGTRPGPAGRIEWLAVLPLRSFSGDTNQDFFVDGMTDLLIGELPQIGGLQVKSLTTVMNFKGSKKSVPEIAKELNVDAVVEGSVQRDGNEVLNSVQLIEAASDRHLWARKYPRDLQNVLKMKSEVAEAIASGIKVELTPSEKRRFASAQVRKPEAVENFLKGRYMVNRSALADLRASIDHFNRAIEIEPGYAEAYAGLANAYTSMSSIYLPPLETMPRALTNALKALELNNNLDEAHTQLGRIKLLFEYDFPASQTEFRTALRLSPNSAGAHDGYSTYLVTQGNFSQAFAESETANRLDPLSMLVGGDLVSTFFYARQYSRAVSEAKKILETQPGNHMAEAILAMAYALLGEPQAGIKILEPLCGQPDRPPALLASTAYCYILANRREDALKTLAQLEEIARQQYVCVYEIACVYAALGQNDTALEWLYKAFAARADCIPFAKVEPLLDPLRADPRFKQLLTDIGFPP